MKRYVLLAALLLIATPSYAQEMNLAEENASQRVIPRESRNLSSALIQEKRDSQPAGADTE
jgi:hypothetical protein